MRTTEAAVRLILDDDTTIAMAPFMETASLVVEENLADKDALSDARLEMIERWLSAHFYRVRDPAIASEKAGPVGQAYQYKLGDDLKGTAYGQQAVALDTTGTLAGAGKKRNRGGMFFGGTDYTPND